MQMSMDMDDSAPTPLSCDYDGAPPVSSYRNALSIDTHPNEAVNMLTARLSELSIESHFELQTTDNMDDNLHSIEEICTMDCESDNDSDEDNWMDFFYDLKLDEQLRDTC
jgi:hypothetical protein